MGRDGGMGRVTARWSGMALVAALAFCGCGPGTSGSTPDGSAVGAGETGGAGGGGRAGGSGGQADAAADVAADASTDLGAACGATGAGGTAGATATGGATGSGGSNVGATGGAWGTGGATGAGGSGGSNLGATGGATGGAWGTGGATGAGGSGVGGSAQGGASGSAGAVGGGAGGVIQGGAGGSAGVAGGSMACRPQPAETNWSSTVAIGNAVGEPLPIFAVADDDAFVAEQIAGIQRWRNGQLMLDLATPAPDNARDVWGTSGSDVWAVGSRVWHRTSVGWTEVATPVTVPGSAATGLSLNTVWGRAADDVYVGGKQGILLHWNGAAWTRLPDPLPAIPDRATIVTGIFASAASDVWIIGTFAGSGAPANLQHWDGATWTMYTRTAGAWAAGSTGTVPHTPIAAIWGSGARDLWIAGGTETGGVAHYDGVRWTDMPPPGLPTDAALVDITGACASDVWVVGARVSGFDPVLLSDTFEGLVYHFDGVRWTRISAAPAELLRGVALSPGRVWTTGRHALYGSPR